MVTFSLKKLKFYIKKNQATELPFFNPFHRLVFVICVRARQPSLSLLSLSLSLPIHCIIIYNLFIFICKYCAHSRCKFLFLHKYLPSSLCFIYSLHSFIWYCIYLSRTKTKTVTGTRKEIGKKEGLSPSLLIMPSLRSQILEFPTGSFSFG